MTLIAGIVWAAPPPRQEYCASMVEAQRRTGDELGAVISLGAASFGRNLCRFLPEDAIDRQPLIGGGGDLLLTGDVRLNQRYLLGQTLGWSADATCNSSDADLLLASWERWGDECVQRIRGDSAFAVYDRRSGRLTLARSALSAKELFLYQGRDFVAFASTIGGLEAIAGFAPRLDISRAVGLVTGIHSTSGQTLFEGVQAVQQGHILSGRPSALIARRFWTIERQSGAERSIKDLGGELRHRFREAVQERLRRAHGGVASHMSAGRDCSAVTVAAARLLARSGSSIDAYTAAPRIGFKSLEESQFLVDESRIASDVAQRFPNINHHVVRPAALKSFAAVDAWHRISPFPIGDLPNFLWSHDIFRAANHVGASVLLTGLKGNLSFSAGGMHHLVDVLCKDGPWAWWNNARQLAAHASVRWSTLLNLSFGPFIPASLYAMLRAASGRGARRSYPLHLLRAPLRQAARDAIAAAHSFRDLQPPKSYFEYQRDILYTRDDSSSVAQALWGLDIRDPTGDRDLVEFCLAFSPGQLVGGREPRPIFRAAFADDLPDAIHRPARRGLQAADWFEQFSKDLVAEEWGKSASHDQVNELFDVVVISKLIARWPTSGWDNLQQNLLYRNDVLGAVSLANFIRHRF